MAVSNRTATLLVTALLAAACGSAKQAGPPSSFVPSVPTSTQSSPLATTGAPSPVASPTLAPTAVQLVWSFGLHADPSKEDIFDAAAIDAHGDVFVLDSVRNQVVKLDAGGHELLRWGSRGAGPGQFHLLFPYELLNEQIDGGGIAADRSGHVYVADVGNFRIQKFTTDGHFLLQWGKSGEGIRDFGRPIGVAVDGRGDVYMTDDRSGAAVVRKFDPSGHLLAAFGGLGSAAGAFKNPNVAGVAPDGTVYVSDDAGTTQRVLRFSSNGDYVGTFGEFGRNPGQIAESVYTVATATSVYVDDLQNEWIDVYDSNGGFEGYVEGTSSGEGHLVKPETVAVDAAGDLHVFDSSASMLFKLHVSDPA